MSKKTPAPQLPPDIVKADLERPKGPAWKPDMTTAEQAAYDRDSEAHYAWRRSVTEALDGRDSLLFYLVSDARKGTAWVLTTLLISKPGRRSTGSSSRYYAIGVEDRKLYTVGRGPHVKAEVTVYPSPDNMDRLQKYLDLFAEGLEKAGQTRDRISSRRAQGQLYRAQGRSSWMW